MSSVIDILRARKAAGHRDDGRRVALVLPAGGLGSVATAGMLAALQHCGYGEVFDAVYGSSAGAHTGCYFLGSDTLMTARGYDVVSTHPRILREIFDLRRAAYGKAVYDIDRFFSIMDRENPVDWERFWRSTTKLRIVATEVATGAAVVLPEFQTKEELILSLRASMYIPVISPPNRPYRGVLYADGGFAAPVPWEQALADGATHMLVIRGWSRGATHTPQPWLLRAIARIHPDGASRYPRIFKLYDTWHERFVALEESLNAYEAAHSETIHTVYQSEIGQDIGLFPIRERERMHSALVAHFRVMADVLGQGADPLPWHMDFSHNPLADHFPI